MRSKILCGIWAAVISFLLVLPASASAAYAASNTPNGGNGGLGNGMGSVTRSTGNESSVNRSDHGMHAQSTSNGLRTSSTSQYDVSVYGTGTGSQFFNLDPNVNKYDSVTADRDTGYRAQSYTSDLYRAQDTGSSRGMGWNWLGWLGLLGLFGLLGNRNPQRDR
ncbi:hypothetical protein [Paenibacillus xylaniclasticus]|uniref:hypothetical protein n=1 Tax=Paenibacillus xylaniclasticus TaxID=588083 RepID=UPI000FDA3D3A|nr:MULTISPECIES: hypothetical protein [Paenibacillus]GFN32262.1 hypothetical protein PCURB6_25220 [Paenibacillus curdlanolyticus]